MSEIDIGPEAREIVRRLAAIDRAKPHLDKGLAERALADEPILMLEVVNRSREPSGEFKHYWLRVPPNLRSSQHAWNWLNGYQKSFRPTVIQS